MYSLRVTIVFSFLFATCGCDQAAKDGDETYKAVKALHSLIDDDQNGNVDYKESADYIKTELKSLDVKMRKQQHLHGNDESLTADEIWITWKENPAYSWDNVMLVKWFKSVIQSDMPSIEQIQRLNLSGRDLPLLATNQNNIIAKIVSANPMLKQKLMLRAQDVVLFGVDETGFIKDIIIIVVLILLVLTLLIFYNAHRRAKRAAIELEIMTARLSKLLDRQEKLDALEEKVDEKVADVVSVDVGLKEVNLSETSMLITEDSYFRLVTLLRKTYTVETDNFTELRNEAAKQLREAKQAVEKLGRARNRFWESGSSSNFFRTNEQMAEAKQVLEKAFHQLKERINRWREIEGLLSMQIANASSNDEERGLLNSLASCDSSSDFQAENSFTDLTQLVDQSNRLTRRLLAKQESVESSNGGGSQSDDSVASSSGSGTMKRSKSNSLFQRAVTRVMENNRNKLKR